MPGAVQGQLIRKGRGDARTAAREPAWVRWAIIGVSLGFLVFFLLVPLVAVFAEALDQGVRVYLASLRDPSALAAIRMTLLVAAISVPANLVFGLAASWAIAKFNFVGKSLLVSLIDLPFAISPVISGMIFMLVFGMQGWFGPWLLEHNIQVVFAVPGLVLATTFVTFPFVARELIPLMQEQGPEEEEAALLLGASGWQTFWRVTLPNVKWGLLYGVILCNARAMGEFGAVHVVCGDQRGSTNTIPLQVAGLWGDNKSAAAFALASLLALLALVTLVAKSVVQWRAQRQSDDSLGSPGPEVGGVSDGDLPSPPAPLPANLRSMQGEGKIP